MKFKEFLTSKDITLEAYEAMEAKEVAKLHSEYQTEIAKGLNDSFEAFKKDNDLKAVTKQFESVTKSLTEQGEVLSKLQTEGTPQLANIKQEVDKFIADNMTEIKNIHKSRAGVVELTVKAVADMTTGSALNPDGIPELVGTQIAPPSNINLRGTFVEALTTNVSTSLSAYPYTETVPKEGDYTFLAEGAIKPQQDFKIETRYASPVKTASWIRLTDESVQDIAGLQSIANDLLKKKHDLKKQSGILFGDGIAPNPKGATTYGRAFVAGSMALAVTNPNIMDVINAAVTDVYRHSQL